MGIKRLEFYVKDKILIGVFGAVITQSYYTRVIDYVTSTYTFIHFSYYMPLTNTIICLMFLFEFTQNA